MIPHSQMLLAGLMILVAGIVLIFDFKYGALRDSGDATITNKPFSLARVQLTWWTIIIFSAFAACIFVKQQLPNLDPSLLVLLGISGATTLGGAVMDSKGGMVASLSQSNGFFADILNNGDIHRLQALLFNSAVGVWFVFQVGKNLITPLTDTFTINLVLPDIPNYTLGLLGISSALYLGMKNQEK